MTIEYKDSKRISTSGTPANYWDFDGSNDYVSTPDLLNVNTYTVSGWISADSTGDTWFKSGDSTNGDTFIGMTGSKASVTSYYTGGADSLNGSTDVPSGWNHVVAIRDASTSTLKIYLNGTLDGSMSLTQTNANYYTNNEHFIGKRLGSGGGAWDGKISFVTVWHRALSVSEITELYNSGGTSVIPTTNLVAHYNFAQTGSTLTDQANSNDGTNNGAITGGTRTVTQDKPTNVQDNSLLVEKDTAKRYWFNAQTGDTPTFEDDYDYATQTLADSAWVPTDTAKIRVNVTNDNLAYTAVNDGSNDLVTHDLGVSVSETKWVLRWKQTISTLTDGGTNQTRFCIGLGDTISGASTNQDFIGMFAGWFNTSAHKYYYTNWANGGRGDTANSTQTSLVPATGTKYYELIRTSASTFEFSISSTSAYTKDVLATQTITGVTATGLRYIKMFNREGGSGGAQIIGTVDDLYFYNDITSVTSVTPATWTNPKDFQGVSGLKLRLDASLGITGSSTVSAWADQSFKGDNNFVQATSGSQPTLTASNSSFNNKPTLSFDGSDDNMTCTFPTPLTNDCSVYMVTNGSASTDSKWYEGVGTLKDTIQFGTDQGGGNKNYWSSASATTTGGGIESANAVNTAACIFRLNYELNGKGYKDGVEISTSSNNMKAGIGVASLTLGGEGTGGFGRGNFRLAEFLLFDHVLSASDNTLIMTYLEDKYSL